MDRKLIAMLLVCCALIAGCTTPIQPTQPAQSAQSTQSTTMLTTIPTSQPQPKPEPEPQVVELTLTFVGDCTLGTNQNHPYENTFHQYYDDNGEDYFLENVRHIFAADDLTVVNLEGSLTNATEREEKLYNHKGPPEYVQILTGSSVEVATLGNNHRLDYGEAGLAETVETLENAGIDYCYNQVYLVREVKGVKVGFVSVSAYDDGDGVEFFLNEGYRVLRQAGCSIVVACIHWGEDKMYIPNEFQTALGHKIIDMGYDLVVGSHPHVLQGIETIRVSTSVTASAISVTAAAATPQTRTAAFSSKNLLWWMVWSRSVTMCNSFRAHYPVTPTTMTINPDCCLTMNICA